MKNKACILILLAVILFIASSVFGASQLCADKNIKHLRQNFQGLYQNDYECFWEILNKSANAAVSCKNNKYILEFLELININTGNNIEFEEFISEKLEELCIKKTECFFNALLMTNKNIRQVIISKLNNPIFHDKEEIDLIFRRASGSKRYSTLSELYFDDKRK